MKPERVNKLCQNPDLYEFTGHDASVELEVAQFLAMLTRTIKPAVILETGTGAGASARHILQAIKRNGHGWLYTIEKDPKLTAQFETWVKSYELELDYRHPVTVISKEALNVDLGEVASMTGKHLGAELAFFDTSKKERIVAEIRHFAAWMKPGATLVVHDTGTFWPTRAALERLKIEGYTTDWLHFETPRGVSMAQLKIGGWGLGRRYRRDDEIEVGEAIWGRVDPERSDTVEFRVGEEVT